MSLPNDNEQQLAGEEENPSNEDITVLTADEIEHILETLKTEVNKVG
jgi:hypothetical protein